MMLDDPTPQSTNGIVALENELLIRDFIDLFNDGALDEMRTFLHPDVVYRAPGSSITGPDGVLGIVRQLREAFDVIQMKIRAIGLGERTVLVEHSLRLALPGETAHWVSAFATFELRDYQICEWRQVHG